MSTPVALALWSRRETESLSGFFLAGKKLPFWVVTTPATIFSIQDGFPLDVKTAEWATPPEEELKNLQSDLEKAREKLERDLRLSF